MPFRAYSGPIYLYHATKPPKVVFGEQAKREAMFDENNKPTGYGTEYIHQDSVVLRARYLTMYVDHTSAIIENQESD